MPRAVSQGSALRGLEPSILIVTLFIPMLHEIRTVARYYSKLQIPLKMVGVDVEPIIGDLGEGTSPRWKHVEGRRVVILSIAFSIDFLIFLDYHRCSDFTSLTARIFMDTHSSNPRDFFGSVAT